jgi:hypothetical protein
MDETKNIINGRAAWLVHVRIADSFVDEYVFKDQEQVQIGDVIRRVKAKHPIDSKIWTSFYTYLRDGTFIVLCNDREVARYTLEPDEDFLDCLEECLLWVMETYHPQLRELELPRRSWWRRAISRGRRRQ